MEWQTVGTIVATNNLVYTPVITGQLVKFKHISNSAFKEFMKVVIRQSFDDAGVTTFFDSKLIKCKEEQDAILFTVPRGITNRRLAIVRVDSLINEPWNIEIESLEIVQDTGGLNLPINISDVSELQQRIDALQAELTLKATEIALENHALSTNNPHIVTLNQLGGESSGTAQGLLSQHEISVNHPTATGSSKGMFASEDKIKLDNIEIAATANYTNEYLLERNNHEGMQSISSVNGLDTELTYISNELTIKASSSALISHTSNISNPHNVTAVQVGAEVAGSVVSAIATHEGSTNHPLATTTVKGMLSGSDKQKLDNIAIAATANYTNEYLLDRSKHLGTQDINTISTLSTQLSSIATELSSKALSSSLSTHVFDNANPHNVTLFQIGGESAGSAASAITQHENTSNHPIATNLTKGMLSPTDKTKLNAIANNATANSTDTYLLDRTNHQGFQAISTITNLATTLATAVTLTGDQTIAGIKTFNGKINANGTLYSTGIISGANFYMVNCPVNIEVIKTLPGGLANYVDIGTFDITGGGICFRLSLVINSSTFSLAKVYTVIVAYAATDTDWLRLIPTREVVNNANNNCEIDIKTVLGKSFLRLRRAGSTGTAPSASIRIEFTGNGGTVYAALSTSGTGATVVGTYPG